eukprot:PhM_4_TR2091/c2_g1_i1/m.35929
MPSRISRALRFSFSPSGSGRLFTAMTSALARDDYRERDIEDALGSVSEDVKQACSSVQMFSGDMYVAELRLPSVVSLLENSLKELARFPQAVEIRKLLSSWTEDASPQDKHRTFCTVYPSIQEAAVISSLRGPKSRAPKLGGATRWLVDKFECISYIRDHMLAIYNFVADELSRSKTTPCNAIHSMYNIMNADSLKRDGRSHVDALILQADDFLAKSFEARWQR